MLKILTVSFTIIFLFFIRRALIPAFIGLIIAYVLDPYVHWISIRLGNRRFPAVILSYLTVLAAAAAVIWGFANIIAGKLETGSVQQLQNSLNHYYLQYRDLLSDLFGFTIKGPDMVKLLQSLGSGTVKLLIGMVAGVYLLKDKSFFLRLGNQALHLLLPQKAHGLVREILFEINEVVSAFLRGVFIDSVVVAFLSALALSFLGVDFAIFIGCFAGVANIIPYFGPVIGIVPAFLSALADGGLTLAIAAAASLFAVQQIECNFIYPRIIGKSTGLHPLFVLVAVSAAGALGGLVWMILAVPATGIVKVLICKWAENQ